MAKTSNAPRAYYVGDRKVSRRTWFRAQARKRAKAAVGTSLAASRRRLTQEIKKAKVVTEAMEASKLTTPVDQGRAVQGWIERANAANDALTITRLQWFVTALRDSIDRLTPSIALPTEVLRAGLQAVEGVLVKMDESGMREIRMSEKNA